MIAFREGSLCLQSHFPYFVCSEQLPFLPAATPKLSLSPFHSRCLSNAMLSFSPFLVVNSSERCLAVSYPQEESTSGFHGVAHFTDLPFPSNLHHWSGLPVPSLPSRGHCHTQWKSPILCNHHLECPPLPRYYGLGEINSSVRSVREQFTLGNQCRNKTTWDQKRHHSRLGKSCPKFLQYWYGHIPQARYSTLIAPVEIWISWSLLMVPSRSTK